MGAVSLRASEIYGPRDLILFLFFCPCFLCRGDLYPISTESPFFYKKIEINPQSVRVRIVFQK